MISFVLAATDLGSMLVPRHDYGPGWPGVGGQLLDTGSFDPEEINLCCAMLALRRKYRGDNLLAIDAGANIGTHTIAMARVMQGNPRGSPVWGRVLAIEAQERLFYALCGNITLNNANNAQARLNVLGDVVGMAEVPQPDYGKSGSFGSVEMGRDRPGEFMGQEITTTVTVPMVTLDTLPIVRLDFLKLDIEGMELAALDGGAKLIELFTPIILVERIKSNDDSLRAWLKLRGYHVYPCFMGYLAVHEATPESEDIKGAE